MRTRFLPLALLAVAGPLLGACADATTPAAKAPSAAPPAAMQVRVECAGDVRAGTLTCRVPDAETGGPKDVILGSQHVNVTLTSSNVAVAADTFGFDLTVRNLLRVALGTTDGSTPDPDGVQVFIAAGVTTTQGAGAVTLANADGVGLFTASNQPYIAYHEIIQPGTVSQPRRWKMQFDPGVLSFSFVLMVNAAVPNSGSATTLTIAKPARNALVPDSMAVVVGTSGPALASATAEVKGRVVVLGPLQQAGINPAGIAGTLWLTGLPPGTDTLTVRAVDVLGDTAVAAVPFIHDNPPRLTVAAPMEGQVVRGTLQMDIDCSDDVGCTSTRLYAPSQDLASGTTGLHGSVSLTQYAFQQVQIQILGTDTRSQLTIVRRNVYVDTTAALVDLASGGIQMLDADSTRSLYRDSTKTVWLDDRVGGTHQQVATQVDSAVGYLHPSGAVIDSYDRFGGGTRVIEFHDGTASVAGPGTNLRVEGGYAAWTSKNTVYRCDLSTGAVTVVSTAGALLGRVDVAANGDVVYGDSSNRDIVRYSAGTRTVLVHGPGYNYDPVTDGTNVLYQKTTTRTTGNGEQMAVWRGGTEEILTAEQNTSMLSGVNYDAVGGWIAYPALDMDGASQVRVRSPDGVDLLATYRGSSGLRALARDGTIVTDHAISRFPYGTSTPFDRYSWGIRRFHDRMVVFLLGRSAFTASY